MNKDRVDELLAEALATGVVPADATMAERAEVERLMETGAVLRAARSAVEEESSLSFLMHLKPLDSLRSSAGWVKLSLNA